MKHVYKGNVKISFWLACNVLLILLTLSTNHSSANKHNIALLQDTLVPVVKSVHASGRADTTVIPVSDTFSLKVSKELTSPINYEAQDSMVVNAKLGNMILYGKESKITYSDNELTAPKIEYDQKRSEISAVIVKDSSGKVISFPNFKQGEFTSKSDTIRFNMKTGKGMTKGTYTQQGEMYVYGEKIKKVSPEVFYAFKTRFTTCNLDTPHFAFVSREAKFVNKKWAYSGPVHPEFEGVPLPIYLPFGIYPLNMGRHSGVLAPSFTANEQMGLAMEGLGYYKIINDHWDVVARGTIYSYGGWTAAIDPRYYKRYKYRGNLSLEMQRIKNNFVGDPDYFAEKTFKIRWTHNSDMKSRPGVNFMASVAAASSKFNEQKPNNPNINFENQMQSTISYSKTWKDKPFNIAIRARHDQNTNLRLINVNFPDLTFNINTIYPFRRKEPIGPMKWYENLGFALNTSANSRSSFYDTAGHIFNQISENLQWGAIHTVPISISLPSLGPVQITPSVGYQEKWYQRKFYRVWNSTDKKVDTVINNGFFTARDMSFNLGATTRIFGMYTFGRQSKVSAIRHEIRPSVSISYKPDMNGYSYYNTQIDTLGRVGRFSYFDGTIPGPFSEGKFAGLSFALDNNISMKVRNKNDTSAELKKVSLIDGLSLTGSYNFLADSFALSPLNLSARSNLFGKISITAGASLDPYLSDSAGNRIDKLVWSQKFLTLGKIRSGNISLQSSFRGGEDKGLTTPTNPQNLLPMNPDGYSLDEYQQEAAYIRNNPGEFADFSIPWNVDVSYSLQFGRERKPDYSGFRTQFYQDLNLNGSLNLTPKWKIGMTAFYNITNNEIGSLSMYLSRDLHCWQMAINISPVGRYRFFTITINPKSPILRDLKVNRTRYFYQ